jgi:putative Mg2+ transporter-C (MgtC) family protein
MAIDSHVWEITLKLIVSVICGSVIGAEREFRNKSAGLRTMILICLGSTMFTIISTEYSHATEVGRIASNIVTGIGFLGAGAIMRDGLSVSGLTTASTIWVVASIGMAVGVGEFVMSGVGTFLAMVILILFNHMEKVFGRWQRVIELHIVFKVETNGIEEAEEKMNSLGVKFSRTKECRREGDVKYVYELKGKAERVNRFIEYLIEQKEKVKAFEY